MTRNEKRILSPFIKQIVLQDKHVWWLLKREIWDLGYQSYYLAQGEYLPVIEQTLANLPADIKASLIEKWNNANPKRDRISYSNFVSKYTLLVLGEVTSRARSAAHRSDNW